MTAFNDDFLRRQANPEELGSVVLRQGGLIQQVGQSFTRVQSLDEIAQSIGELDFRARDADGKLRMIMSAISLLEELGVDGHFAGVDANGVVQFYISADSGKITIIGEEFPSITPIEWIADDTKAPLGKMLSFYVPGVGSGLYLIGQGKDSSHYGVAGLVAMTDAQTLGQYKGLIQVDTLNGGRAFVEFDLGSGVLRRSYFPAEGWQPYILPEGVNNADVFNASSGSLAANGGSLAYPITIHAPMLLQSATVWNNNTASARTWNWYLYRQLKNTGDASENALPLVANGAAAETFTPGAATARTIAANGAPVYLAPGTYWFVVQNQHATNTFEWGRVLPTNSLGTTNKSKTLSVPPGSTLDFVAATWTSGSSVYGFRLNGRVFGETSAYA